MAPRKFNPYVPNGIVTPGMFTGRIEEIETAEQALFQAVHGNAQHFIFEGERGIGKSSLIFYVEILAQGKISGIDGDMYNFLSVSIDLAGVCSQVEIIQRVAREFRRKLGERDELTEIAKKAWDFLTNWEVLGVKYNAKEARFDADETRDQLVNSFVEFLSDPLCPVDGVLLLIDEADSPNVEAGLGEFMKMFTERLMKRDCSKVLVGLAGLPNLVSKLRESHESSPRVFQIVNLSALNHDESIQVIHSGLGQANKRNPNATSITKDAEKLIAELSEGYPHFLQQFCYFAFQESDDDEINRADVLEGAYMSNGALSQLGDKYFSEMYHARISSEEYRKVLNFMAGHGDAWVSRKEIVSGSEVSDSNVNNALAVLKDREIILQDISRRGFYRLPTKSFAAWINAIARDSDKSSD